MVYDDTVMLIIGMPVWKLECSDRCQRIFSNGSSVGKATLSQQPGCKFGRDARVAQPQSSTQRCFGFCVPAERIQKPKAMQAGIDLPGRKSDDMVDGDDRFIVSSKVAQDDRP